MDSFYFYENICFPVSLGCIPFRARNSDSAPLPSGEDLERTCKEQHSQYGGTKSRVQFVLPL